MAQLLIVDDEPSICWGLTKLGERMGHQVQAVSSAEQALQAVAEQSFDVIVLDVRLPGMDGLTAMTKLRESNCDARIVVITAHGNLSTAVEAVRQGAFEYLVKPFDLAVVERTLQRALQPPEPVADASSRDEQVDGLVGKTPIMQEVYKRIALVAPQEACVLLQGESGTGKELVARAIHRYSGQSDGPFVAVNVASLSPALVESELFGHARGAYTGAEQQRTGLLVQADGGTLFLDEVADIPAATQVKLLRALERGEVVPVGSNEGVHSDFRVVSATHQNLEAKVEDGSFRHDLFYRLCTFQIDLPPLRSRHEDIRLLAEHFVGVLSSAVAPTLSATLTQELEGRPWHGNVRELRNAIEHALIVARNGPLLPEHLPAPMTLSAEGGNPQQRTEKIDQLIRQWAEEQLVNESANDLYDRLLELIEPPLLEVAMEKHRGLCAAAARTLGMHRTTLRKKLDHYHIEGE